MDKYNEIMAELEKTEELLLKEIRKVNVKNDLTPQELNSMKEAVCLMKDIIKLEEMMNYANEEYDEYSEYGDGEMSGRSYMRGRDARTGRYMSRSRGSGRSMNNSQGGSYGNYSNYSNRGGSYENMSRGGSYEGSYEGGGSMSRHSIEDRMVAKLEGMMDTSGSDYERQKIGEWINKIRTES